MDPMASTPSKTPIISVRPEPQSGAYGALRRRVYELLEQALPDDFPSRVVDLVLMTLILLTAIAITLESMEGLRLRFGGLFNSAEVFFVTFFSAEYALRLWSAADNPAHQDRRIRPRLSYMLSPMALIDLAAVLPFYLIAFGTIGGTNQLLILRSVRLLRVLKLTRYSTSFAILSGVIKDNVRALGAALFLLMVIMLIAASGIYVFERDAQPVDFGSIPAAMWWAFATLTTVGYGDVTPITVGGKVFGAGIAVVGIGMVALPTAILASAFSEQLRLRSQHYSTKVDSALEDGLLTTGEQQELEVLRKALGIGADSAERILATEYSRLTSSHAETDVTCPHCNQNQDEPRVSECTG